MNNTVSKSKVFLIVAFLLVVSAAGIGGAYFIGRNISRGEAVTQFLLTQDVARGHSIEGKYKEESIPYLQSINKDNLITSEEQLKDAVAYMDMYKNQPITKTSVGKAEDLERNLDFSMASSVEGTIANSLEIDDIVAIKVKFDDARPDACVVSSIPVADIKTSNGEALSDKSTVPGYLLFHVSNEESADLNAASKEGELYIVRYRDLKQPKLEKTYSVGSSTSTDTAK